MKTNFQFQERIFISVARKWLMCHMRKLVRSKKIIYDFHCCTVHIVSIISLIFQLMHLLYTPLNALN